ncbi:uncharacterized protein [Bemisia tabaci]|uniref:uncharacterized protein n=1 Tax=Bemisia tabaci TaxID=7038 RepID=UPI003B27FEE5
MVPDRSRSVFGPNSFFPQLRFCCCGCSLRMGVLIIGWFTVIVGALMILGFWPVANRLRGIDISNSPEKRVAVYLWVIDYFIDGILLRIAGIILLIGVYAEKPKCVLLFLIASAVDAVKLVIEIPLFIFTNIDRSVSVEISSDNELYPLFEHPLGLFITLVLTLYFLAVTNSYYSEMENAPPKRCGTGVAPDNVRNA